MNNGSGRTEIRTTVSYVKYVVEGLRKYMEINGFQLPHGVKTKGMLVAESHASPALGKPL
jgi:hypothetical protein